MKLRGIVILLMLGIVSGVVIWSVGASHELVYEGKPLSKWVDDCSAEALTTGYMYHPRQLPRDVKKFGRVAVPTLTQMLEANHSFHERIRRFLVAHRYRNRFATNFIARCNTEALRPQTAAYFLGWIGQDAESAIPALMRATSSTNKVMADNAVVALGAIHERQDVIAPFLAKLAMSSNGTIDVVAVGALGKCTRQPALVVPILTRALTNRFAGGVAATRLCNFGVDAASAVPALRVMAADTNFALDSRFWAAEAMWMTAPNTTVDATVPVYARAVEVRAPGLQDFAIQRLQQIGPAARPAIPVLLAIINGKKSPLTNEIVAAIKAIDPEAAAKAGIK